MSKEIVIKISSLTKKFKLYDSHRDRVKEVLHPLRKSYHKLHYALKDVSFSIEKGEVLGIIGQNGSGKSTLLKLIASVSSPSSGTISSTGKITALLELGGGFDMNLTGIENIHFLSKLQGFTKKELPSIINNILDFADIGEYANQPVKTYSSGMYVRLAFSVSININPDILIVDEALAVGDLRFQQKCYRKIREFKDLGKTIIICTHNLSVVKDFCNKALWLHDHKIKQYGNPHIVADSYNKYMTSSQTIVFVDSSLNGNSEKEVHKIIEKRFPKAYNWIDTSNYEFYGNGDAKIISTTLIDNHTNRSISILKGNEDLSVLLFIYPHKTIANLNLQLILNGQFGSPLLKINSQAFTENLKFEAEKYTIIKIRFNLPKIGNGHYSFSFGLSSYDNENNEQFLHWIHDTIFIEIANPDMKYNLGTQLVIEEAIFEKEII